MSLVLVRGVGEIASAVAHRLHRLGARVAMHEQRLPVAIRRRMAFSDAIFDGTATLDGVTARRVFSPAELARCLGAGEVPMLFRDFGDALTVLPWTVLIDARMAKARAPEVQRGLAPLVVGLGPGCTAGGNVDVAVETSWEDLGRIVRSGPTLPLRGEPRAVMGHARDRFRYAPRAGVFRTEAEIGQRVAEGEVVGWIEDVTIRAVFAGTVRGVTRDGVPVEAGTKVAEIDPRDAPRLDGIDHRPGAIADAVADILVPVVAGAAGR